MGIFWVVLVELRQSSASLLGERSLGWLSSNLVAARPTKNHVWDQSLIGGRSKESARSFSFSITLQ
jgi:hypothetical protein